MENIIIGKKVKMTQVFLDSGKVIPVTILKSDNELDNNLIDKKIIIVGTSKGKGFSGVMKKWNFKGGQATHGQSKKPRSGGSIGSQTPSKVYKGKKMAGRMGSERVTVKGLKIIDIFPNTKEFLVSGPVPGSKNSLVSVKVLN